MDRRAGEQMSDENEQHDLPGQRDYRSEGFDIGVVVKSPFLDDKWVSKIIVMGLFALIPIIGGLNLLGYVKACFDQKRADSLDLPEAGLSYIGAGFRIFVAFLPLGILFFLVQGGLSALNSGGFFGSLLGLVGAVLALGFSLLCPAILYVAVVDDDTAASIRVERLKSVVMRGGAVTYLLLVVTMFGLSAFANAGALVLCIGSVFTTPLAAAMAGAALVEFDRES